MGLGHGQVEYFDVTTGSTIAGGDPFEYYVNSPNASYIVIDENGNGAFDSGEPYITETGTGGTSGSFPGSKTDGLLEQPDNSYDVYALDKGKVGDISSVSSLSGGGNDEVFIDGSAPYVSDVSVTNPSGQDVGVSVTTNEQLNGTTVDLSGPESATVDLSDFAEANNSGTYTYTYTYVGGSDGDYTAEVTSATDSVGNDAANNQSSGLTDSVSVDTTPPGITGVEAEVGNDTVLVSFNESVEATDGTGLTAANFTYGDAASGGASAVSSVSHTADSATATLTLDADVTRTDLGNDTVAAGLDEVSDGAGNTAPTDSVPLADTEPPSAPTGATAGVINATTDGNYNLTVDLPDDHEAGTLTVALSNGATVTDSQYVPSEDDGDSNPDQVAFTGLDVSSLDDGTVTVDATLEDDGGNAATGTGLASPAKDADRPGVASATITNATIGTEDAGVEQTVTVDFDEDVQTTAPNVTVVGLNRTYDVSSGSFTDATTWTGTVTIRDDNEAATATIRVENATDTAGNVQTPNPDESNSFDVDTRGPVAPTDVFAGNVTASNATSYEATVDLVSGSQADTVEVRVSDGTSSVRQTASTGGSDRVTVTGIDVSSLNESQLTVSAQALDGGFANAEGFVEPVDVTKDTVLPSVSSVTVGDGTIDDADAGTSQSVTVEFDEPVDQGAEPTVTLTGLAQGDTSVSGSFVGPQTWSGSVTVDDNDEEADATVAVSGAADLVGNTQDPDPDTSGSVTVDTSTPAVSNLAATHTGGGTVEVSFEVNQTLTTASATLETPTGTATLTPTTADASAPYVYTATYTGDDGDYTATLDVAEDDAGNDGGDGQTANVTVDTTAPTFGPGAPTGPEASSQPELTLDVSDATRDVNASSIEVTVEDAGGVVLDAATTDATGISYSGTTLTVNTSDAGVPLADGSVDVTVSAADTVDNRNQTSFSFTVDTTAPTFTNLAPEGTTVTDDQRTVSVDVTDATVGVDSSSLIVSVSNSTETVLSNARTTTDGVAFDGTTLTIDPAGDSVPALPNGSVDVAVSATDSVGNSDSTTVSFTVDTPPAISGFSAVDTAGDRNATVSFDSSDDLTAVDVAVSGAESASLSLADFSKTATAGGFEYAATYEGSTDGTYDFTLQTASDGVTDAASEQTASALVDEAAPDVTVTTPNGGELYAGDDTVTIEWTATDNVTVTDDVQIEYSADGGSTWTPIASGLANDGSYDWTAPTDDTTAALVRVTASDSSSNEGVDASDAAFEVDSTAPAVQSFAVSNPDGQAVTVTVETDEPLDAASVAVSGATTRTLTRSAFTETGSGPYTYEATFDDGTNGTYDATLDTAADAAGNDGAGAESDSVEVDTVTPTISNVSVTNPSAQTVNVSFDASERLASTAVELETPTGTTTLSSLTETGSGPYTYYATYDENADGWYDATLTVADDGLGNDGATGQTDSAEVDTTPPTVSNYSVTNPDGQQVRVEFDADEPIDEVAVDFTGPETASVSTDNPTTTTDGSYVVTYAANADGQYSATLASALDADGNDGGGASGTVEVATAAPIISGFSATNPEAQNVTVSFGSDEPLDAISVDISGAETATLTESNFTQSGETYTATYVGSSNGTYTAVLQTAKNGTDDGASGETNSVTVGTTDDSPTASFVSGFSATSGDGQSVRVSFDSSVTLTDIGVAVTGADTATLTTNDFTESNGTYTATVAVDADGEYTATLFAATDGSGTDGADGQSATATVDTTQSESGDGGAGSGGGATRSSSSVSAPVPDGPSVSVTTTGTVSAAAAVENADAGSELSVPFGNATRGPVSVASLAVTTSTSMDYSLSVASSADPAPGAPSFDGRAVGHVEVTHSFDDADVSGATMTVAVSADRFADTGVDPESAAVYRYHDGDWARLATTVVERTADSVVLEADTPGFSSFAVGVRDADAVRVSGASVTASTATVGDAVPVSVTVDSNVDWQTDVTVAVTANGSTATTRRVTVPPRASVTVAVDVAFDTPGDYRLSVGDTSAGTLAVRAPSEDAPSRQTTTDRSPTSTDGPASTRDASTTATTTTSSTATPTATSDAGESSGGSAPGPGPAGALLAVLVAALAALRAA
ncbi:PGF-pre-PGF domain-containing protein [Halobacterium jilantaiense]|uniref:PGF-pre-PGF domain-containing protein n=1 Tax=Halobacterium jilantaiense TaxID=355548 RepID=UPI00115F7813|nr:PGF-pre-PGF domain-containing protein [Halobacterium jilantaiense]